MPLPTSPTMLLAAASLALVFGRYFRVRTNAIWGSYFVAAFLLAAYSLWADPIASSGMVAGLDVRRVWINDPLALAEQWLVLVFGLLSGVAFFDSPFRLRDLSSHYGFLSFAVAALMLVARSNDFLSLGMSLEIVNLATMALYRSSESGTEATSSALASGRDLERADTVPVWLGWLASGSMWFGIALLSNATATTQFDALRMVLTDAYDAGNGHVAIGAPSKLVLLAVGLIVMSLFARMGQVPFQLGFGGCAPGLFRGSSGFAMLAGQLAGSIALARLCGCVFVGLGQPLITLLIVVSLATFFWSGVMTVRGLSPGVKSVPRLLTSLLLLQSAWLSVGLMVVTTELEHPDARWGAFPQQNESLGLIVFSQLAGILACGGLCWSLDHLARVDRNIEFLEDVKGLGQFAPIASIVLIISLASCIGCPWTGGFWGRWLLMLAGHNVHIKSTSNIFTPHPGLRFVMLAGTVASIMIAGVVIRLAREMFLESPLARPSPVGGRGPLIAALIAATASLLMGVAPQLVLSSLRTIEAPRVLTPETPQRGSGKNHSALRSRIHLSTGSQPSLFEWSNLRGICILATTGI